MELVTGFTDENDDLPGNWSADNHRRLAISDYTCSLYDYNKHIFKLGKNDFELLCQAVKYSSGVRIRQ
ncbi:MAG TPA: hypothetical protein DEO70_06505 [Bacteroidales bacterium]|nr:hypothetical protein [Bacteroidales bacterium]